MKIQRQARKALRYALIKNILRYKHFDVRESIILCSEPRSGSTWLMEMLQKHPKTIVNWEPLHVELGVVPERHGLGWRPFIAPDDVSPENHVLFEKILTMKLQSPWTTQKIDIRDLWSAQVVLTKFVRAIRLLPWFTQQFDLRKKPVYLVRHPVPTCLSQEKHFPQVNVRTLTFGKEGLTYADLATQRFGIFKELASQLELRVALWAMYNAEVMHDPGHGKSWISIYYEDLMRHPVEMIESLNTVLNLSIPTDHLDPQRASRSDFKHDFKPGNAESHLNGWMDKMSHSDLIKIQQILEYFKITAYSAFSPYPL